MTNVGSARDGVIDKEENHTLEAALRVSEAEFRTLTEAMPQLVWITLPDGTHLHFNQQWVDYTGVTLEQSGGNGWASSIHPEERELVERRWAHATQTGEAYETEYRLRRTDGAYRWMLGRALPLRDASGVVVKWIGTCTDIDDLRRANESTRNQAALLSSAQRIGRMGSWSYDIASRRLTWDEATCALFGITAGEFEGTFEHFCRFILPEDFPRYLEMHAQVTTERSLLEFEYRIRRAGGEVRWLYERGDAEFDGEGKQVRRLGMVVDITEQRATQQRLREHAQLLDKAQDAIMVRDLEHRVLYWNKSAERLYGYAADEVKGRPVDEFLYARTDVFRVANDAVMEHGEWVGELEQITKGGELVTVEGRWTLVRDDDGVATSILAINTDITNRKRLEQQFIRAQRLESIGTLAGGIAHDLNNVLAPIIMSIDLLKESVADDPQGLEMLELIRQSAARGADMVRQVLSFARGVEGKRMAVHAGSAVHELLRIAQDTFPKSITLTTRMSPDLWLMEADPTQLHQVLLNLCVNARDAMPAGGTLTISAQNLVVDEHYAAMNIEAKVGPYVVIEVEDSGSGIPPEILDRVFDPFFTTKEVGKGTGLGLATTLAIVKGHGGFIRVYSDAGAGTRFRIYLPAQPNLEPERAAEASTDLPRGNGELILVVDDEPAIRQVTKQTLEAFGYRVLLAADGSEAVTAFVAHQHEVRAVVTDMMMPVMDGRATIQVLRRLSPDLPIIGASGLGVGGNAGRASGAGVELFLSKPYTAETLLAAIRQALGG